MLVRSCLLRVLWSLIICKKIGRFKLTLNAFLLLIPSVQWFVRYQVGLYWFDPKVTIAKRVVIESTRHSNTTSKAQIVPWKGMLKDVERMHSINFYHQCLDGIAYETDLMNPA